MGFTASRAEHPLDPEDRPPKRGFPPVAAMSNKHALATANACPVRCGLQVYACQFSGIINLCNWYIDKGRSKV